MATKIAAHVLLDVTGRFTCVVIFVGKSCFPEILIKMKSGDEIDLVGHAEADRERGSRFRGFPKIDMLGVRYESVNFGAEKSVIPPNRETK